MNTRYKLPTLLILLPAFSLLRLSAQNIDNEVYVESSYRPDVADADKISSMPEVEDTMSMATQIDYTLLPSRVKTDYDPRPIKAATMVGTPLDKLYNSYLKLGLGNYTTPLVEYSIQNLRSKDYAIGAYFFHKSSHNKLELDNTAKVPAGYGRNVLSLYGKKFMNDVVLTGNVGAKTHRLRYYGYNTANFPDSVPEPEAEDIKQSFMLVYGEVGLRSNKGDSSDIDFNLLARGEFLRDHYKFKEPHFKFHGNLSGPVSSFRIGTDIDFDYFALNGPDSSITETLTTLHPYLLKRKDEWEIRVGGRLTFVGGQENKVRAYPEAMLRFHVIEDALVSFFGVSGYIENNSYQSITDQNPYVIPGLLVRNTTHRLLAYGGIEGHLSKNSAYQLAVSFDEMEDMPFFLNDTNSLMQNQFGVVYDDADLIKIHGELDWRPYSYLKFFSQFNYYNYRMVAEDKPWHRPDFDFTFATTYNFKEKVYASVEYIFLGKRYAKNLYPDSPVVDLPNINDLNLKLEYKYSNVFSVFLDFYNLLSKEYYVWNQYPGQRINIIGGITYKF